MKALTEQVRHHWMHAACGVAAVAAITAIAFGAPLLGLFAVLFCGAMMVSMVWMMVGMATKHRGPPS